MQSNLLARWLYEVLLFSTIITTVGCGHLRRDVPSGARPGFERTSIPRNIISPRPSIRTNADKADFPPEWLSPELALTVETFSPGSVDDLESRAAVETAFDAYAPWILDEVLDKVHIVRSLSVKGAACGGTYSDSLRRIYVVGTNTQAGRGPENVIAAFHHEFSSLFYWRYEPLFRHELWFEQNPRDFRYGTGGLAAIQSGNARTAVDPKCLRNGFVSQYAMVDFEEDFNQITELLFTHPRELWALGRHYPRIEAKANLVVTFYGAIDQSFVKLLSLGREN